MTTTPTTTKPTRMLVRRAILQALHDEMESDPDVIVMGEDVAVAGGPFKCTEGLHEAFGPRRVLDTPISEMGFLGAAVGAAATGLKPVVEIMFVEFIGVALDQLTTEATRLRYLSRGEVSVPLVVRSSAGAGLGFGCQHSQMLDYWFRGVGGLKVCVVSNAQNAYGLLRAAIRDPDPVVVLEPRVLYGERQQLTTGEEGIVALGEARVVTPGDDVTIVTAGTMVGVTEEAASLMPGTSCEIIDLQTLVPWDRRAVVESVRRTGRLVVVEEGPWTGGWSNDIAAHISAELFGSLQAPVLRVTCPDVPVPHSAELERRFLPSPEYVAEQTSRLIETSRTPAPWWAGEEKS
ncbi:MAG TPA: transketolase C-terminal domain-containing protein [Desertimonas sp.]|nr:transketolase C-terminal domain-containing protein [Desertimonas sp.]